MEWKRLKDEKPNQNCLCVLRKRENVVIEDGNATCDVYEWHTVWSVEQGCFLDLMDSTTPPIKIDDEYWWSWLMIPDEIWGE